MKEEASDVPLESPRLSEIAARVLISRGDEGMFSGTNCPTISLPASQALLRQIRFAWNQCKDPEARSKECAKLHRWAHGEKWPLAELDLTGARLDDRLLADLLQAHSDRIISLDIIDTEGITGDLNSILEKDDITLPGLSSLTLNNFELLAPPPPKRKHGTAGIDRRTVPMLGEEELSQHIESKGPLLRPTPNHPYDQEISRPSSSTSPLNMSPSVSSDDFQEAHQPLPITSRCPNLRFLALPRTRKSTEEEDVHANDILCRVLMPLGKLEYLDLSYWHRVENLRCIYPCKLTTLILYDVPDLYRALESIYSMTELRYLDLSQAARETGTYPNPVATLCAIISKLTKLTHLDISGTNLAAQPTRSDRAPTDVRMRSDIAGLSTLKRPLEYLGLFNCDNASHVAEIPAEMVAGDANEDQVITALKMYSDRSGLLQAVLNESYQLYRFGMASPLTRHTEALHLVLDAMRKHLGDSTLQIAGSASLFYIIRRVKMNWDTKKSVVSALLSGMERHIEEQVMVRNCCLSLCQFEIPQEILFDYSRLALLLVKVLEHHNSDNLTQRIVVFLLNSMACHVEGDQKVQVGSLGAIEMILNQIRKKHQAAICDDVMEVGWSFLWNITDETPVNCEKFLVACGLELFQKCYDAFKSERELVRNMMGLIGNIAEVNELRPHLMQNNYISIFCDLLKTVEESIEISYNSAGVLAHMVSDGDEAWEHVGISRQDVMEQIVEATKGWKLDTRRFINYRSFKPILRLLPQWHAFASQHWAVWALANLTTTDPAKYCQYVINEGGVELLVDLQLDRRTHPEIKKLVEIVLKIVDNWKQSLFRRALQPGLRDMDVDGDIGDILEDNEVF
ncbi:unnamed protein product, partial [Mesorhabditis spiculigera]